MSNGYHKLHVILNLFFALKETVFKTYLSKREYTLWHCCYAKIIVILDKNFSLPGKKNAVLSQDL